MPAFRRDPRTLAIVAVGLLTLVAALLRLATLGAQSLWYDEAVTWQQVNGSFFKLVSDTLSDNYPPLYNLLTWPLVQLFGDAEWVLRLPASLLGIATVPMIYLLGARLGGRTTGLIAALFLTLSGFHVWYSQEARMYSLLAFAATTHAWVLLRYLDQQTPDRRNWLIASGAILLFTHPYGPLTWLCQGAGAFLASPRPAAGTDLRKLIKYHLISAAIFFPWGAALLVHAVEITIGGFWIPSPTPSYVWHQLQFVTGDLLLLLLVCAALAVLRPAGLPAAIRVALPMLLLWLAGPILLGLLASVLTKPVFVARYVIGSLPALFLLAAYGITRCLPGLKSRAAATVACGAVAIASLLLAPPSPREDWRGAVAEVQQSLGQGDCVLILPFYNGPSWEYYYRDKLECLLWSTGQVADQRAARPGAKLFVLAADGAPDRAQLLSELSAGLPPPAVSSFLDVEVYSYPATP